MMILRRLSGNLVIQPGYRINQPDRFLRLSRESGGQIICQRSQLDPTPGEYSHNWEPRSECTAQSTYPHVRSNPQSNDFSKTSLFLDRQSLRGPTFSNSLVLRPSFQNTK